jgi:hypothetical protein
VCFRGSLVWGPDHHYGEVYNFQVQTYKGEPVLIFWAGDDSIGGHGEGKYYMVRHLILPILEHG